jgi:hypothetical protein
MQGKQKTEKLTITTCEQPKLQVVAQYNPRELQVTQPISWTTHQAPGTTKPDAMLVEFGGMQPQTMQIELFFDGFETNGYVPRATHESASLTVEETIALLKKIASPRDASSTAEDMRRPYNCLVTWGTGGLPKLLCVIESLVTKYTMFAPDGRVLRATCTVSLKEANLERTELVRKAETEQAEHDAHHARQRRAS